MTLPNYLVITNRVFAVIDANFVDAPDFGKIRVGAVLGLGDYLASDSFVVKQDDNELTVSYRLAGEPQTWKNFSSNPDKQTALNDIYFAFEIARKIKPTLPEEAIESVMLTRAIEQFDQYSTFFDREGTRQFDPKVAAGMGGVGLELSIKSNQLTVVGTIADSPAQRAGILTGDRILKIDGNFTQDRKLADSVTLLRGPLESEISLQIFRDGWPEAREMRLRRATVRLQPIQYRLLDQGIGLITIRTFPADTVLTLEGALLALEKLNTQDLILDLRGNSGGLVSESISVAGMFMKPGELIVSTAGRAPRQSTQQFNKIKTPRITIPLVILVDKTTAAGAEIVAAALQEAGRAQIVGTSTFGNALIQTLLQLPKDRMLKLTTSRWLTAKGRSVDQLPLTPDFPIEQSAIGDIKPPDGSRDIVLERAVEVMKTRKRQ